MDDGADEKARWGGHGRPALVLHASTHPTLHDLPIANGRLVPPDLFYHKLWSGGEAFRACLLSGVSAGNRLELPKALQVGYTEGQVSKMEFIVEGY